MDFKAATDRLGKLGLTHDEIAGALGVSTQLVRQARLDPGAASYRRAPAGWELATARLAWHRASGLAELAAELTHPTSAKVRDALRKLSKELEG